MQTYLWAHFVSVEEEILFSLKIREWHININTPIPYFVMQQHIWYGLKILEPQNFYYLLFLQVFNDLKIFKNDSFLKKK